jgi:hypothetical protein
MPSFDPIHIPTFVAEKYQNEMKTIKKYLTDAFPDSDIDVAYSVDLLSIGFRVTDENGYNIVYLKTMFIEDLDLPLNSWLDSSGIKEFLAMNNQSTLIVKRTGELKLQINS